MAQTRGGHEIPRIGRGKKMSIAKAGLIVFFDSENYLEFFDVGTFGMLHNIVEVAGAKHSSSFTAGQVMECLRKSDLWEKFKVEGYKGIRGMSNIVGVKPSQKGISYYNQKLKHSHYVRIRNTKSSDKRGIIK